jgi:hypothetical protein
MIYEIKRVNDRSLGEIRFRYLEHNEDVETSRLIDEYFKDENARLSNKTIKQIEDFIEWLLDEKGFRKTTNTPIREFIFHDDR